MFPTLSQALFFVFLGYLVYIVYYYWILQKSDVEGLETQEVGGRGGSGNGGLPGKEFIDENVVYKVISSERQDKEEENYADVPDNGQAVQFMTDGKDGNVYIINPITGKPFYIHKNSITINVQSIQSNKFPERSLLVNVVAKCANCKSITNWELFVLPIQNIDATVDVDASASALPNKNKK